MTGVLSRLLHSPRIAAADEDSLEDVNAFIESRALEYPTHLEEEFVKRALGLGIESGMVLDVGTRVGLILLKILWQNENLYGIGLDSSPVMIERARETAAAWELERAFFQVGDARKMRFKAAYFDLVVSDRTLHRFDEGVAVLKEIARVLKPRGALLIRDFRRPNRFTAASRIRQQTARYGEAMGKQLNAAFRSAYTRGELLQAVHEAGLTGTLAVDTDANHVVIERRGETDPGSWVVAREQYR